MFTSSVPLLEIVARVSILYVGLFVLLRLLGRRQLAELAPMDFLAMLVLSETVSPALTRSDPSVTAALVAAATLLFLTFGLDWATFRWRRLADVVEGEPRVLVTRGRVNRALMQRERIARSELVSALRREGVASVRDVRIAVLEPPGRITVIPRARHAPRARV